jgi:hypothetical protein
VFVERISRYHTPQVRRYLFVKKISKKLHFASFTFDFSGIWPTDLRDHKNKSIPVHGKGHTIHTVTWLDIH